MFYTSVVDSYFHHCYYGLRAGPVDSLLDLLFFSNVISYVQLNPASEGFLMFRPEIYHV
jgi:hypothetical protein